MSGAPGGSASCAKPSPIYFVATLPQESDFALRADIMKFFCERGVSSMVFSNDVLYADDAINAKKCPCYKTGQPLKCERCETRKAMSQQLQSKSTVQAAPSVQQRPPVQTLAPPPPVQHRQVQPQRRPPPPMSKPPASKANPPVPASIRTITHHPYLRPVLAKDLLLDCFGKPECPLACSSNTTSSSSTPVPAQLFELGVKSELPDASEVLEKIPGPSTSTAAAWSAPAIHVKIDQRDDAYVLHILLSELSQRVANEYVNCKVPGCGEFVLVESDECLLEHAKTHLTLPSQVVRCAAVTCPHKSYDSLSDFYHVLACHPRTQPTREALMARSNQLSTTLSCFFDFEAAQRL